MIRYINKKNYVKPMIIKERTMTNYEAIKNLMPEQLVKFLDQVFLTGLNTGYHSLVDPDIHDGNPFHEDWINAEVNESLVLVENESGEDLVIEQLVSIVMRIADFDVDTIPENISWQNKVVLPKGKDNEDEIDDEEN